MDLELYRAFVEKNHVPEVRKVIYDYLMLGHYDIGFYWGRLDWTVDLVKNLPISCSAWYQYVSPNYAQDPWSERIDKTDYSKICAGKRVICLNLFTSMLFIERFRQKVKKAKSVTFYETEGYDLREKKIEEELGEEHDLWF